MELQQSDISVQLNWFIIFVLSKIDSLQKYKDWKKIVRLQITVKVGINDKRFSYLLLFNQESINETSLIIFVQVFEIFYKSNL